MNEPPAPEIDVVKLMEKIQAEAKRDYRNPDGSKPNLENTEKAGFSLRDTWRDNTGAFGSETAARVRLVLPEIEAAVRPDEFAPRPSGIYSMRELVKFEGPSFVRIAYLATLGRAPDDGGFANYIRFLRAGATKTQVLGWLAASPEGVTRSVKIKGLKLQERFERVSRWPLIGRVALFLSACSKIVTTERRYRILTTEMACELEQLRYEMRTNLRATHDALRTLERFQNLQPDMKRSFDHRMRSMYQELQTQLKTLAALVERPGRSIDNDPAAVPATFKASTSVPTADDETSGAKTRSRL